MKKNLFFVLLAILTLICRAYAAEWVQIGEKSYLDASSMSPYDYRLNFDNDGLYSIWKKSLNDGTDMWKNLEKNLDKKLWYNQSLLIVNCTKKEIAIKSSVTYDLKDKAVSSENLNLLEWRSIVPESNGEFIYTLVCNTYDNVQSKSNNKIIKTPAGAKIKVRSHK